MNSFRILDRRWLSVAAVFALLIASIVPALAFAAQVTERSIELSNSSAGTDGVTYRVKFKAVGEAKSFVVEFCGNSPLIGSTCADPAVGFNAGGATSTTTNFTDVVASAKKVVVTNTNNITAGQDVEVDLLGINNPDTAGPLYARIVTYDTKDNAQAYTDTNLGNGEVDRGSVALSITPTVGVSGAVQESLSFCIAKNVIAKNCVLDTNSDGTNDNPAPTLALGQDVGGTVALQPGVVSEGTIWTQLSTNAVGGAVISLKSATSCGGLKRFSATTCDIAPALTSGVDTSSARFGVRTADATDATGAAGSELSGTLRPVGSYNNTTYVLNYLANNTTGVTSTYGDQFLDTNNAPVNNKNMQLTFAAAVTNQTPAGLYSTDLSMIATGKF
jgi:hypothetical protein